MIKSRPTEEIVIDLVVRRAYLSLIIPILHGQEKEDKPNTIWDMEDELKSINWLLGLFAEKGYMMPDET